MTPDNATYCKPNSTISWDHDFLNELNIQFGDFVYTGVLSHEWGHLNQDIVDLLTGFPTGVSKELHADCQAGIASAILQARGVVDERDLVAGFTSFCFLGTPGSYFDPNYHGTCDDRSAAFSHGVSGAKARLLDLCTASPLPAMRDICESYESSPVPPPPNADCGNGAAESAETCDRADLRGQSCSSLGFTGGTLGCAADCKSFDTSGCTRLDGPSYQFHLTWRSNVDMDIHVLTPEGHEIAPGVSSSADGGMLDGNDQGGGGLNQETVTLPSSADGDYEYFVRLKTGGLPDLSQVFCFEMIQDGHRRRIRAGNLPYNGSYQSPPFRWPPTPPDAPECPENDDSECRCPTS